MVDHAFWGIACNRTGFLRPTDSQLCNSQLPFLTQNCIPADDLPAQPSFWPDGLFGISADHHASETENMAIIALTLHFRHTNTAGTGCVMNFRSAKSGNFDSNTAGSFKIVEPALLQHDDYQLLNSLLQIISPFKNKVIDILFLTHVVGQGSSYGLEIFPQFADVPPDLHLPCR